MKHILEKKSFALWGHFQNILDDSRTTCIMSTKRWGYRDTINLEI